jgi:hypothetical protein
MEGLHVAFVDVVEELIADKDLPTPGDPTEPCRGRLDEGADHPWKEIGRETRTVVVDVPEAVDPDEITGLHLRS